MKRHLIVGTIIYSVPFIQFIQKWINQDKWDAINDGPYNAWFLHEEDIGLPISVVKIQDMMRRSQTLWNYRIARPRLLK